MPVFRGALFQQQRQRQEQHNNNNSNSRKEPSERKTF